MIWGLANLRCDMSTGTADLVPLRTSEMHLNVIGPMMSSNGMSVVMIPGESDPPNGLFTMDISLKHPFTGKPQFSGFDVKGILMTQGTESVAVFKIAGAEQTQLLNRDGLTRWWNPSEFTGGGLFGYKTGKPGNPNKNLLTATVNPYKTFADYLTATSPVSDLYLPLLTDDKGRGVFTSGTTNTRRYKIKFPVLIGPVVVFNYAIDASWVAPEPNPPDNVPDDFPIAANQPEAFLVDVSFPTNTLTYLEGGQVSGQLTVQVKISDWQGLASGSMHDEIGFVYAMAPTLITGFKELELVSENALEATYSADVSSSLLALNSTDPHIMLVSIVAQNAGNYTQFGTTTGPLDSITAFQTAQVEIAEVTCEADSNNDVSEAVALPFGEMKSSTVCNPGGDPIDVKDFYTFDVPVGYAFGDIDLYCSQEPTKMVLYNATPTKLDEQYVYDGHAEIPIGSSYGVGTFYVEVVTENQYEMVNYVIENHASADPCGDPVNFNFETQVDTIADNNVEIGRNSLFADGDDVWIVYSQGPKFDESIMCRHSTNGGITFEPPVLVNDVTPPVNRYLPSIGRDPGGRIFCGWVDERTGALVPMVDESSDGGQSWGTDVSLYDFETGSLLPENSPTGVTVGTDLSGRVYAVWLDARTGENHLYCSYSDDHGTTWTPAEKIDDSSYGIFSSLESFDVEVTSNSQEVFVVWADNRHKYDPPLSDRDIYFDWRTNSTGFGADKMVNPPTLDAVQDYPAITNSGEEVYVAWVDGRNDGSIGGGNPSNTRELFFAHSFNVGDTWLDEAAIPIESPGFTNNFEMNPRIQASPWGNPYVAYWMKNSEAHISRSCDGGASWNPPVVAYTVPTDCYTTSLLNFSLATDGRAYIAYEDTRVNPGPDHPYINLFMSVSD
jgi:hypothetical protein